MHLEADLLETVKWADAAGRRWAFTLSNAGARYTEFRNSLEHLDEIDWAAVRARDFRDPHVKEGKQAEFLVHGAFAWRLVQRIGVESTSVAERVSRVLIEATHRPVVGEDDLSAVFHPYGGPSSGEVLSKAGKPGQRVKEGPV